ncbi:hypothetical protein Pint_28941 [Pistacia integerrima]|uniref:Uncharacterized protein n=1 Tax=Pistacia integerrima TaxID=434235 RepID=A0ACC0X427_9ROSI|nr:hypothetical protein Pint_28941 [Pistacia integerrima]
MDSQIQSQIAVTRLMKRMSILLQGTNVHLRVQVEVAQLDGDEFFVKKRDSEMVQADHVRDSLLELTRNPSRLPANLAKPKSFYHGLKVFISKMLEDFLCLMKIQGTTLLGLSKDSQFHTITSRIGITNGIHSSGSATSVTGLYIAIKNVDVTCQINLLPLGEEAEETDTAELA